MGHVVHEKSTAEEVIDQSNATGPVGQELTDVHVVPGPVAAGPLLG